MTDAGDAADRLARIVQILEPQARAAEKQIERTGEIKSYLWEPLRAYRVACGQPDPSEED